MLPSAIRPKAIPPGAVRCVFHRHGQVAPAPQQTESVVFPDCLADSQCPSRPKMAEPALTASLKPADELDCVADVWGWLHGPAFTAGPARAVSPVRTHSW